MRLVAFIILGISLLNGLSYATDIPQSQSQGQLVLNLVIKMTFAK